MPSRSPENHKSQLLEIVTRRVLTQQEIEKRNRAVSSQLLKSSRNLNEPNFRSISNEDLGLLFHAIDEQFFGGKIAPVCEQESSRPLRFRLSTRMTSTGGTTTRQAFVRGERPRFEIAIATTPLFKTFQLESTAIVGGRLCSNRLEAMQRIMEHEMIHLVELLLWNDSSCSANRFRQIAHRLFAHTETKHRMLTPREVAYKQLGIAVGDSVSFDFEGRRLSGVVNRISKRATVLVPAAQGTPYSDGKTYHKYFVPLHRLVRTDKTTR